ncbi:MAG: universal stress protein, partial [Acidobacteriota bacterium]
RKREYLQAREKKMRNAFAAARQALLTAGFPESAIQEHMQEKKMSAARHACSLAEIRKVDAVLVPKRVSSSLEGFLKDDSTSSLLQHCRVSPIWIIDGSVNPVHAAVCLNAGNRSLMAADHAAFMLSETSARITVLYAAKSIRETLSCPSGSMPEDLKGWLRTDEGRKIGPLMEKAVSILKEEGISEERMELAVVPAGGGAAQGILSHCRSKEIGTVVLGRSDSGGETWSFLKGSVTRKLLADARNMAVFLAR